MTADWRRCAVLVLLTCSAHAGAAGLWIDEGTNISADVNATDGRIAIDLLGDIWTGAARGGELQKRTRTPGLAQRPRWSPDGREILFQMNDARGTTLWRLDVEEGISTPLTPSGRYEQTGDWHPDGDRVVFSAARDSDNLDIWERDLGSGLEFRLSSHPGNESEPAWSADGRHLCYVLHEDDRWYLVVRRFSREPQRLLESPTPIMAPSWRPDNTLISYLQQNGSGRLELKMLILSDPPLARTLVDSEDFFPAAASWIDRSRFVYTADGAIKVRHFEDRSSKTVRFYALVSEPGLHREEPGPARRPLPPENPAKGEFVVRAARLYDGHGVDYRHNADVIVRDGVIAAIEDQRPRPDQLLFDIGDVTVMPGLIDIYAGLPEHNVAALGPLLLSYGVTTLVSPDAREFDSAAWAGENLPGPTFLRAADAAEEPDRDGWHDVRLVTTLNQSGSTLLRQSSLNVWRRRGVPLLADNWRSGLTMDADLLLGTASAPVSPQGRRYGDIQQLTNNGQLLLVSGSAGATTPGVNMLSSLPQASLLPAAAAGVRRFANTPLIGSGVASIVVGSRPSGLAPGLATQAELLALQAAGLPPYQVLHAATGGAATALGLGSVLGRIAVGARADLLLIAGDPLASVADAAQVVAVVHAGRFQSVASLIEQIAAANTSLPDLAEHDETQGRSSPDE